MPFRSFCTFACGDSHVAGHRLVRGQGSGDAAGGTAKTRPIAGTCLGELEAPRPHRKA